MPDAVFSTLAGVGVAGIWLLAILLGFMYPKGHVDDLKEQIAEERERANTERTRADVERARADAAVETARTANLLLASLRRAVTSNGVDT